MENVSSIIFKTSRGDDVNIVDKVNILKCKLGFTTDAMCAYLTEHNNTPDDNVFGFQQSLYSIEDELKEIIDRLSEK